MNKKLTADAAAANLSQAATAAGLAQTKVNEQTENALFIVENGDQELMVPAVDDLIVEFDTDKKVMVMELPEGILDLNP